MNSQEEEPYFSPHFSKCLPELFLQPPNASVAAAPAYSRFQPKPATSYNQRRLQFPSGNDRFSTNGWNRDHGCATGLHLCHGQFKYAGASSIDTYQTWYNDYGKIHHEP